MYRVVWTLISTLLGLAAFTVTAVLSVMRGEEPLMAIAKAIGAFMVLWVLFSLMGLIFRAVVPTGDEKEEPEAGEEPVLQEQIADVSDSDLPDLSDLGFSSGLGKTGS